jgi:DNA-binding NtrC family response regulator
VKLNADSSGGSAESNTQEPKGNVPILLIVDDDSVFRDLEAQILSAHGYHVLQAGSAAEALRLAETSSPIALLLTDFCMPGVDGLELIRRFRAAHPETPALMVSGSLPAATAPPSDIARFELLAKPFTFDELLQKVRTLLEAVPRSLRPA